MTHRDGIGFRLDPADRRRARIRAAQEDVSLSELVRRALLRLLDDEAPPAPTGAPGPA